MGKRCISAFCSNTNKDNVSLFLFPKDPTVRQKWSDFVRLTRDNWKGPTEYSVLCSNHFSPDCLVAKPIYLASMSLQVKYKKVMKSGSIPTLLTLPRRPFDGTPDDPPRMGTVSEAYAQKETNQVRKKVISAEQEDDDTAREGRVRRCEKAGCQATNPVCFASATQSCARNGYTSRWYHLSCGEHFCNECFDFYYRSHKLGYASYITWQKQWTRNSMAEPSLKTYMADQLLPYWGEDRNHCSFPEDSRLDGVYALFWPSLLAVPPLLHSCPAAPFVSVYPLDSVGLSPTGNNQADCIYKPDPWLQPFRKPGDLPCPLTLPPNTPEATELEALPGVARDTTLYLGLRNLILALWNLQPQEWLTPELVATRLFVRGLVRVRCVAEVPSVLAFLERRGFVNTGAVKPPRPLSPLHGNARVLVIGAGLAGLCAAHNMHNAGFKVVVLEARSRVGGRVCDEEEPGMPGRCIAKGANVLHGAINNPLVLICRQLGIPLLPLANDRHVFRGLAVEEMVGESRRSNKIESSERVTGPTVEERRGADESHEDHATDWAMEADCGTSADTTTTVDSGGVIRRVEFITEAVLDALADWRERSNQSQDVSLEAKLQELHRGLQAVAPLPLPPLGDSLFAAHLTRLEMVMGAPLSQVSAFACDAILAQSPPRGPSVCLVPGLGALTLALSSPLEVHKDTEVTMIDYSQEKVQVQTAKGCTYTADKVLVTVPTSVLKAGGLQFKPALPAFKQSALEDIVEGRLEKVVLEFPWKFWRKVVGRKDSGVSEQGDRKSDEGQMQDIEGELDMGDERALPKVLKGVREGDEVFCGGAKKGERVSEQNRKLGGQWLWRLQPSGQPRGLFSRFFDPYPEGGTVLVGEVSGAACCALDPLSDGQAVGLCVQALREAFPGKVPPPTRGYVTRWGGECWGGAVGCALRPGADPQVSVSLAQPLEGRLFFAGEATVPWLPASATAACVSGLREAVRMTN
uniref:lysine-specific histone demethylase 2 isoform X2 n=1 Tax=Myxine glutinosa TaxID=7769 RepID=UPI00358F759E